MCLPDTISPSVRNPAVVFPGGQVQLGATVTLTCNVPGKPVFNNTRYCIYYQGQYQLLGADYECGGTYTPKTRYCVYYQEQYQLLGADLCCHMALVLMLCIYIVVLICDCFDPFFFLSFLKSGLETPDRNGQWYQHLLTLYMPFLTRAIPKGVTFGLR